MKASYKTAVIDAHDQDPDDLDEVSCVQVDALIDNGKPLIYIAIYERDQEEPVGSIFLHIDGAWELSSEIRARIEKARELLGGGIDAFERAAHQVKIEEASADVTKARRDLEEANERLRSLMSLGP